MDHPEHCGGVIELAKAVAHATDVDTEQLVTYLLRLENGAAVKRLVYLADLFNIELPRRDELDSAFTTGYSKLDPTRSDTGQYDSTYRLVLNVSEDVLLNAGGVR